MSLAPATGLEASAICLFRDAARDDETSTHETRCRKANQQTMGKDRKGRPTRTALFPPFPRRGRPTSTFNANRASHSMPHGPLEGGA